MSNPSSAGFIDDTRTYTKPELCSILQCSTKTLNRMLSELTIVPAFEGTSHPLISGREFNRAIQGRMSQCAADRRK